LIRQRFNLEKSIYPRKTQKARKYSSYSTQMTNEIQHADYFVSFVLFVDKPPSPSGFKKIPQHFRAFRFQHAAVPADPVI